MKKVFLRDLRPGYCIAKTKEFMQTNGMDWDDFKQNGIDAQVLIDTGDVMAIRLAERAVEVGDGR